MGNRQVHLKKFTKTFSSVTESVSHSLSLSLSLSSAWMHNIFFRGTRGGISKGSENVMLSTFPPSQLGTEK